MCVPTVTCKKIVRILRCFHIKEDMSAWEGPDHLHAQKPIAGEGTPQRAEQLLSVTQKHNIRAEEPVCVTDRSAVGGIPLLSETQSWDGK